MEENPTKKKMSKKDFGIAGFIGVIGGRIVVAASSEWIVQQAGALLTVIGIACLLIWLYKVIARKA